MTVEARLLELGITLPPAPPPVAAYEPWVRTGNLVFTSGQLPWRGGELAYVGRVGGELTEQQGYEAARICAINAIAQLKNATGDLETIVRIVRCDGFVHAAPGFHRHPVVLNGASELINAVFQQAGRHTRVALGIADMPLNAAVQVALLAEIRD